MNKIFVAILLNLILAVSHSAPTTTNDPLGVVENYELAPTTEMSLSQCSDQFYEQIIKNQEKQLEMLTEIKQFIDANPELPKKLKPSNSVIKSSIGINPKSEKIENYARNCAELYQNGDSASGIRNIYPYGTNRSSWLVYCEQNFFGGGWTVLQKRMVQKVRENFERNWYDYVVGFGDLNGEHWAGLELMHLLTQDEVVLRIDLEDWEGNTRYARYPYFNIGSSAVNYPLNVTEFNGNVNDSLARQNGAKFSTYDRTHSSDCAKAYHSGFWFISRCHYVNLNGLPNRGLNTSNAQGIIWESWTGYKYSLKEARMMIRPIGN